MMRYLTRYQTLFRQISNTLLCNQRYLRNGSQAPPSILDSHANLYRPEVESDLEYLAVQTSRKPSLQINYELEEQRRRQRTIRYHILRQKYVAHPKDVQVNVFVKNHMQFLRKNYPHRWTVQMLSESFNQSIDNVRLILRQRTTRRMRVRPRPPTSLFGIKDEDERERLVREQIMKRDMRKTGAAGSTDDNNDEPVDYRVLAEESHLMPRARPSNQYMERDNDGFFSNVLSTSDQERDSPTKPNLLTSAPTLLDRMNKLRSTRTSNSATVSSAPVESTDELVQKRLTIIKTMQQANDAIVQNNERRQKFLQRPPVKRQSK